MNISINNLPKQILQPDLHKQNRSNGNANSLNFKQKLTSDRFEPSFMSNKVLSTTPKKYIILDSVSPKKMIDVDGDDVLDLKHADIIEKLIKSNAPDAEIITHKAKLNDIDGVDAQDILDKLTNILDYTKNNKVDGINISISFDVPFELFNSGEFQFDRKSFAENKTSFMNILLEELGSITPENRSKEVNEIYTMLKAAKTIEEIVKNGTKVYLAAGNSGTDRFNILSLAQGANIVGATDAQNNKLTMSADYAGVEFEQGSFTTIPIKENAQIIGYDLDNNGTIDVKPDEVSNTGKSVVKQFAGKSLQETLISEADFNAVKVFDSMRHLLKPDSPDDKPLFEMIDAISLNKLLTIDQAAELHGFDSFNTACFKDKGKYMSINSTKVFDVSDNGIVTYNPDRSNTPNAVSEFEGTSYACPIRMVKG